MLSRYWNPLREMEAFQRNMDRMFHGPSQQHRGYPPVELVDVGDQFILRILLPGVPSEDIKISVSGDQVSLHGTKRVKPIEGAKPIRRERAYGEFHRVIKFPEAVDTDRVSAEHGEGVLTLLLPKARAAAPVTIELE